LSFSRSLKDDIHRQDTIIGIFITVAAGLVVYLLLHQSYLGSQKDNWIDLHSELSNSFGLAPGTLIELSGVTIGNVETVTLRDDARVEIGLTIDNRYQNLLRLGSQLNISSAIGLDTVISGVRMELVPGDDEVLLKSGDPIDIVAPQSFDEIIESLELEGMADQAKQIVSSLETIMGGIADSNAETMALLSNANGISATLNQQLPLLMEQLNTTLQSAQTMIAGVGKEVAGVGGELASISAPTKELLATANTTLETSSDLLQELRPSLQQLPATIDSLEQTLVTVERLTRQLSHHWLLGGDKSNKGNIGATGASNLVLLPDHSLYQTASERELARTKK